MKKKKTNAFNIIVFSILLLWAVVLILLLLWAFFASVKDPLLDFRKNILGLPKDWKFSNYLFVYENFFIEILNDEGFMDYVGMGNQIFNTLLFCIIRSGLGTFMPCLVGYLVAKYQYKFSTILYTGALIVMSLPIVGAYPAEISLLTSLGLYDTWMGVFFQSSTYFGVYFFVFIAAFTIIPNDFYDAATIDGASDAKIFFQIMIPMVFTTITTVFLLMFVANWNEYQYALLYLPSKPTLSYGLYVLSNSPLQNLNNVPMRMSGCAIVMLPILILFIFLKEKLMSNISMGGLKE